MTIELPWPLDSNVTKTFKIKVTAKHYLDKDFKDLRIFPEVKVPEGRITEVEFTLPIPSDSQHRYCINVEVSGRPKVQLAAISFRKLKNDVNFVATSFLVCSIFRKLEV